MKDEKGSAVIEATISLTLFMLSMLGILSFITVSIVQSKISFALNTTAREMSQYSYFYHLIGLDEVDDKLASGSEQAIGTFEAFTSLASGTTTEVSEIVSNPTNYLEDIIDGTAQGDLESLKGQMNDFASQISDISDDPMAFVKSLASVGGVEIFNTIKSNVIASPLARGMSRRHFGANLDEANAYLSSCGIVDGFEGLNFDASTIFQDGSDTIDLAVYYTIDLSYIFPFDVKLNLCQRASTAAWLGGDLG